MKCKKCGCDLVREDKFCPSCGHRVRSAGKLPVVMAAAAAVLIVTEAAVLMSGAACVQCGGNDSPVQVSHSDVVTGLTITTTTTEQTTTTTASTTAATTTTTAAQTDDTQAMRDLLVSKRWKTDVMGFDAEIEFYEDGSAQVKLKVLFTKMTVPGKYSIGKDGKFTLEFSYGGETYYAAGVLRKSSSDKLVVAVDSKEYTLTAIK